MTTPNQQNPDRQGGDHTPDQANIPSLTVGVRLVGWDRPGGRSYYV